MQALSSYFGFRAVIPSPDPPLPSSEGGLLPMTLSKCAATKLPSERLVDLVPGDGGGGGGNGCAGGGGGAGGVVLRAEKVQVMRRVSKGEGDEKMPRVEVLSLEDEAARLKQKEMDYEAARSQFSRRVADLSGLFSPSDGESEEPTPPGGEGAEVGRGGNRTTAQRGGGGCGGGGSNASAPMVSPVVHRAVKKNEQRTQDMYDPDYNRNAFVRWAGGGYPNFAGPGAAGFPGGFPERGGPAAAYGGLPYGVGVVSGGVGGVPLNGHMMPVSHLHPLSLGGPMAARSNSAEIRTPNTATAAHPNGNGHAGGVPVVVASRSGPVTMSGRLPSPPTQGHGSQRPPFHPSHRGVPQQQQLLQMMHQYQQQAVELAQSQQLQPQLPPYAPASLGGYGPPLPMPHQPQQHPASQWPLQWPQQAGQQQHLHSQQSAISHPPSEQQWRHELAASHEGLLAGVSGIEGASCNPSEHAPPYQPQQEFGVAARSYSQARAIENDWAQPIGQSAVASAQGTLPH
ncbi:MAG: hypothetical protein SGPRY_006139 [Prymnesium sp.]